MSIFVKIAIFGLCVHLYFLVKPQKTQKDLLFINNTLNKWYLSHFYNGCVVNIYNEIAEKDVLDENAEKCALPLSLFRQNYQKAEKSRKRQFNRRFGKFIYL